MRITYKFFSLKDLSNITNAERFLEILSSYGLNIVKAGDHEPIKADFVTSNLPEIWKVTGSSDDYSSCSFLFKGIKELNFSGMVTWHRNLHPASKAFNGIHLWLNISKTYDIDKLIKLGDDLFIWSEAVYGYITEDSREQSQNVHEGVAGMMWVNYFGSPYLKEPNFHIPNLHVPINKGVKLVLSEKPDSEKLSDILYLENIKKEIGIEWFWTQPKQYKIKVPIFDKSEILRKTNNY